MSCLNIKSGRGKAEVTRPRQGRGNKLEVTQDRGEALKYPGEGEAASFMPRGEASASRRGYCLETHITGEYMDERKCKSDQILFCHCSTNSCYEGIVL